MHSTPTPSTPATYPTALLIDDEPLFECLPETYPIAGDGHCWHLRSARPVAKCDDLVVEGFAVEAA